MLFFIIISFITIILLLLIVSFFTLWERKLLAGVQRRHGPTFVGNFGILQAVADGLKLLSKEQSITYGVDFYVFIISAFSSAALSFLSWSLIPINSDFLLIDANLGLLLVLIISTLNVYSIVFSGWSSNSKYGTLGSLRAVAQVIAYEIPMFLSIFPIITIVNSLNFNNIINFQINYFWLIIFFPAAFLFYITALAETNRTPFDLPEAESELIAGYNIEYSSILFAFFFLGEYNHILVMSALFNILFFGGWSVFPINIFDSDIGYFFANTVSYLITNFCPEVMFRLFGGGTELLLDFTYREFLFDDLTVLFVAWARFLLCIWPIYLPFYLCDVIDLFNFLMWDHTFGIGWWVIGACAAPFIDMETLVAHPLIIEPLLCAYVDASYFYETWFLNHLNLMSFCQTIVFFFKTFLIASTFILIRAVLPRYKYTQLLKMCWEVFVPFLITYNLVVIFLLYIF